MRFSWGEDSFLQNFWSECYCFKCKIDAYINQRLKDSTLIGKGLRPSKSHFNADWVGSKEGFWTRTLIQFDSAQFCLKASSFSLFSSTEWSGIKFVGNQRLKMFEWLFTKSLLVSAILKLSAQLQSSKWGLSTSGHCLHILLTQSSTKLAVAAATTTKTNHFWVTSLPINKWITTYMMKIIDW